MNCTAFSARPLLCGYPGLLVMCLNPQVLEKFLNWNIGGDCLSSSSDTPKFLDDCGGCGASH